MSFIKIRNLLITAFLSIIFSATIHAQSQPFQLSLVAPIQLIPEESSIGGIRLNLIYGRNASLTGLDVGMVNHLTQGVSQGVQFGFLGLVDGDFTGWQDNAINVTKGNFEGLQLGVYNYAKNMNGIQFGFINYAVNMKGLQIGCINIIKTNGAFPVFPIVNWSF